MGQRLLQQVKKLEEKHKQLSLNLIDVIFLFDADSLKFSYITPVFKDISGYKSEKFTRFELKEVLTPPHLKTLKCVS